MKLALVVSLFLSFLSSLAFTQDLPENPKPQKKRETLTWKQTLDSKTFWAVHSVYLGSLLFDIEISNEGLEHEHRGCIEANGPPHPTRAFYYQRGIEEAAIIITADLLLRKVKIPIAPYAAPAVGVVQHLRGGISWMQPNCW